MPLDFSSPSSIIEPVRATLTVSVHPANDCAAGKTDRSAEFA
jgi:hypothetical protein